MFISISLFLFVGLGIFFAVVVGIIIAYNVLIAKRNQVQNAFSTIDIMLKKRADLIPNLVSTVKGYVHHEMSALKEVTALRASAANLKTASVDRFQTETKIADTIEQILALREDYPELKANEQFLQLMGSLHEMEEQISAARRAYNAAVNDYNNIVDMFPTNLLAQLFHFQRETLFQVNEVA